MRRLPPRRGSCCTRVFCWTSATAAWSWNCPGKNCWTHTMAGLLAPSSPPPPPRLGDCVIGGSPPLFCLHFFAVAIPQRTLRPLVSPEERAKTHMQEAKSRAQKRRGSRPTLSLLRSTFYLQAVFQLASSARLLCPPDLSPTEAWQFDFVFTFNVTACPHRTRRKIFTVDMGTRCAGALWRSAALQVVPLGSVVQ